MAETAVKPTPIRPGADPETDGKDGGNDRLGRAIDIGAIAAAVVLGVIIFDMISGGKVKALFRRKPPDGGGEPCQGC